MDKPNGMNGNGGVPAKTRQSRLAPYIGAQKFAKIRPLGGANPLDAAQEAVLQLPLRDDFRGPYSKIAPKYGDEVTFRAAAGSDDLMSQPQVPPVARPPRGKTRP